ncbi:hypothetical protein CEXT_653261 [Caerostris extrusa]|uniref:Uncharacterized protein n=1 Tax=Caerostris extrusa TaxID=172846 RepID=A0AAV4WB70_CAEEX|nr:hypothetical protein CEXT_653261 [Caerostris extrusa]
MSDPHVPSQQTSPCLLQFPGPQTHRPTPADGTSISAAAARQLPLPGRTLDKQLTDFNAPLGSGACRDDRSPGWAPSPPPDNGHPSPPLSVCTPLHNEGITLSNRRGSGTLCPYYSDTPPSTTHCTRCLRLRITTAERCK